MLCSQSLVALSQRPDTLPAREAERCITSSLRTLSEEACQQVHRLTLTYTPSGIEAVRLIPYHRRSVRRLVPIELPPDFEYSYKYADRSFFERVKAELADDEEPLFVRPDGTITDTSFTSVLIETEAGYLTPARPLLKDTQREGLLRAGLIAEADDLTLSALRSKAKAILLINALLPLEEALRLPPKPSKTDLLAHKNPRPSARKFGCEARSLYVDKRSPLIS